MIGFLFGTAFVLWLLHQVYRANSNHWRYLAGQYRKAWIAPRQVKWGYLVLYGKYPVAKSYNGIVKLGIHHDGLALKIMIPPDALYCEPLFIPFKDIRGWGQTWYLDDKSVEIELAGAPEVKLVMPRSQVEWIERGSRQQLNVAESHSPNDAKPVFWYAALVVLPFFMLFGLGTLFIKATFFS